MLAMAMLDWNSIYLTCFGIGLLLTLLAFFGGLGHLHFGHFHFGGHHHALGSHGRGAGSMSPLNGFTLVAFLCWFGGTGYLLHRAGIFTGMLVLLFSTLSGLAGAGLVFWFLVRVLMGAERTLEPADTEMTGVIGRLSSGVPQGGFGEMLYSQNGARRCAAVRSLDGMPIDRDAEVVVMRYERGIAWVRRWDEFEHGLLGTTDDRGQQQGTGARESAHPE